MSASYIFSEDPAYLSRFNFHVSRSDVVEAMRISEAQRRVLEFEKARRWDRFMESQVLAHLYEEISEIGKHILAREGYKARGLGHEPPAGELEREFGQAFSLFLQLANRLGVDLERAFAQEIERMEKRFDPERWRRYMEGRG